MPSGRSVGFAVSTPPKGFRMLFATLPPVRRLQKKGDQPGIKGVHSSVHIRSPQSPRKVPEEELHVACDGCRNAVEICLKPRATAQLRAMSVTRGLKRPNLKGLIAANVLRRAEQASSACAEILWAAREVVRVNREFIDYHQQTIAEARATLERVDRLLAERRGRK